MSDLIYFDQLAVGQTWKSPSRTVTESDIVQFAASTGDFNPLHVDHEFAEKGPFRKPIAHGLLGLAWVAGLGSNSPRPMTLAFVAIREWNFLKPVFVGDTLHVVTEVAELRPQGRRSGRVTWKRQLMNQNGEVVQEGYLETIVALARSAIKMFDSSHATPQSHVAEQPVEDPAHSPNWNQSARPTG